MQRADLIALLPIIVLASGTIVLMLAIAWRRSHVAAASIAGGTLLATLAVLPITHSIAPRVVTPLLVIDGFALFFTGLLCAGTLVVALLAFDYFETRGTEREPDARQKRPEEFYLLLLVAVLGGAVLAGSSHFASLFLGIELLSVSLYALIGYRRQESLPIEAGIKYLVLAGASSAFLLFGMALVYFQGGGLALADVGPSLQRGGEADLAFAGLALIIVAVGFKLALVPFHLWTPDVYAGAPAPVTAFIASVSKGATFAVVLRLFLELGESSRAVFAVMSLMAVASMLVGNLLALLQSNVKRLLAYSSIAHLGYLAVTLLAAGDLAVEAASYYLVAYFVSILSAFAVVTLLSSDHDAEALVEYKGLFWRRPVVAAFFTASLLSLAGIPLTAGFVGKFYVLLSGVDRALWLPVATLILGSVIGLFYYLRVVVVMFDRAEHEGTADAPAPRIAAATLVALGLPLIGLGIYPVPLIRLIQSLMGGS